jgi:hypothetical protein
VYVQQSAAIAGTEWGDLLLAVAEQLKVPLTIIARQAELGGIVEQPGSMQLVRTQADAALQLVDSYLLGLELLRGQTVLELEPVSVSSTLLDAAHALTGFAKQYGVDIAVDVPGAQPLVMAHSRGLYAALLSLGFGLIEAPALDAGRRHAPRLTLAARRTPHGIIAGVYGSNNALHASAWYKALQLCGRAPQPFTGLSAGTGAGLFVAHTILKSMESGLRVGARHRERGLAATFKTSQQLRFV